MNTAGSHTWLCPQCQRQVPAREAICHCGFDRVKAAARESRRASSVAAPAPRRGSSRVLVYGALFLAALAVVIYASLSTSRGDPEPPAPMDDARPPATVAYAPLPTVPAADVGPIDSGRAVPSASMPDAWSALKIESPLPTGGAAGPAPDAAPRAAGAERGGLGNADADVDGRGVEPGDHGARPSAPPDRRRDNGRLESGIPVVRPGVRGEGKGGPPSRNWLVALKAAPRASGASPASP
jgi:hypothetical protein